MYTSFTELLNQWPSPTKLAEDIGAWENNIGGYKKRNSLPSRYFVKLVASARKNRIKGVTFKLLAELAEERG